MWNIHHWLICSNTWSPTGGTAGEGVEIFRCRQRLTKGSGSLGGGPWGSIVQPHKKLVLSSTPRFLPTIIEWVPLSEGQNKPFFLTCFFRAMSSLQWEGPRCTGCLMIPTIADLAFVGILAQHPHHSTQCPIVSPVASFPLTLPMSSDIPLVGRKEASFFATLSKPSSCLDPNHYKS